MKVRPYYKVKVRLYYKAATVKVRPYYKAAAVKVRPYYNAATVKVRPYYNAAAVKVRPYYKAPAVKVTYMLKFDFPSKDSQGIHVPRLNYLHFKMSGQWHWWSKQKRSLQVHTFECLVPSW